MSQSPAKSTLAPSGELRISPLEELGPVAVLHLCGRMEAKAAACVHQRCTEARDQGHRHLALDLSQVSFVSSSGLGVLLAMREEFKDVGGSLHIVAPSPAVEAVMRLLNLHRFLSIAPSTASVVETLSM